jgi:hypothetical protein
MSIYTGASMTKRLPTLDEEIARALSEAAASGELAAARGYGKPLPAIPGWAETPEALRMPFKILRDAGVAPAEIEFFHERARLRAAVEACSDAAERERLRRDLSLVEAKISMRLESLRINAKI